MAGSSTVQSGPAPGPSGGGVAVHIHPSQFPAAVAAAMHRSLGARRMNHKFHYDTPRQTRRWLRVHAAYSPAGAGREAASPYALAAEAAVAGLRDASATDVLSLGSGGGQKDARLLEALRRTRPEAPLRYIPVDVSAGLTLVSRDAAVAAGLGPDAIHPYVMDLAEVADWEADLRDVLRPDAVRLVLFYGMLPNFTPGTSRDRLAGLLRPGDRLLVSANLAPGPDYRAGVERILPQYENPLTRDWLGAALRDLGADPGDTDIRFGIAECPNGSGLLRIEARAVFTRPTELAYEEAVHRFGPGDDFLLFFSYRHTPDRVARQLAPAGLGISGTWLNAAGDEGVFLIGR